MIPVFPTFKPVELSDRIAIEAITGAYPPYSDFEFGSLWSWDVKQEMRIATLNGNLVVAFTDYTTGIPFLSFLGSNAVTDTAQTLIDHPLPGSADAALHLVPEVAIGDLDTTRFSIEESIDHFDYICDVARHITYEAPEHKTQRKLSQQFQASYPGHEFVSLDLSDAATRSEILDLYRRWDMKKGFLTTSESFAYERFVDSAAHIPHAAVGIRDSGTLIAFHAVSLPPGTCADALFSKADTAYRGVYATLDQVVARDLLARGYTHMNIQQDLGIPALRTAKKSLAPAYFLRKYTVRPTSS